MQQGCHLIGGASPHYRDPALPLSSNEAALHQNQQRGHSGDGPRYEGQQPRQKVAEPVVGVTADALAHCGDGHVVTVDAYGKRQHGPDGHGPAAGDEAQLDARSGPGAVTVRQK